MQKHGAAFLFAIIFMLTTFGRSESLTVDLRTYTEPYLYMLSFSAIDSTYNHAFVIFTNEDEISQATVQAFFGFYPTGETSGNSLVALYQAFIGGVDGSIIKEDLDVIQKTPVHVLHAYVNSEQFDAAQQALESWRSQHPTYRLLLNDCVTFADDIAETVGLKVPSRLPNLGPQSYILELIQNNRP